MYFDFWPVFWAHLTPRSPSSGTPLEVLTIALTSPTGARFPPHRCSPRYQARSADCPPRPALRRIRFLAPGQAGLPSTRLRPPSGVCLGPWARQQPHRAPPQAGRGFSIGGGTGAHAGRTGFPDPPSSQRNKTLQLSSLPAWPQPGRALPLLKQQEQGSAARHRGAPHTKRGGVGSLVAGARSAYPRA